MSQTERFIRRLEGLKEGERSRLRRLAGQQLDQSLSGFDLFTGLWWPLRQKNQGAPRREVAWLTAKLYGAFPIAHVRPEEAAVRPTLERVVARCEPTEEFGWKRYRSRFDALLQTPLSGIEPHLRWALSFVAGAVEKGRAPGLDWAQLLDDLSTWDRADEHRRGRDIRDIWAEEYLKVAGQNQRR